jgi:hypothetical protein
MATPSSSRARARRLAPLLLGFLIVPLLLIPATSSVAVSCASKVTATRVKHRVLPDKVVIDTFAVTVTTGNRVSKARVIRTTLPKGARPKLIHEQLGNVEPISTQVRSEAPRALTAINGDFFAYYRVSRGDVILPWSSSVSRGRVLRGFSVGNAVVGVDTKGRPYGGPLAIAGTVADTLLPSVSYQVLGVNRETVPADGVTVYTGAWNTQAPRPAGAAEWVISRGKIAHVWAQHSSHLGASVPPGSRVLAFGGKVATLAANAKVGDPVSVAYHQVTSTGVTLREAVGSRRAMITASTLTLDCSAFDSEPRPRTSVGWTSRGRWMTLIVPGTGYDYTGYRIGGLDVPEEAAVASTLHFANAFILDGGGSVTEWARHGSRWGRVDDTNSAWERYVPNGLAFVAH